MTTFRQLGIPFPLHEAPVEPSDGSEYAGRGTCRICGAAERPCFHLGAGAALIVPCPACLIENGWKVEAKASANCRRCGSFIPFPEAVATKKEPKICYTCLRAGKAALTKDTEFGMITFEQAFTGITHGVPGLQQNQFEAVVLNAEENWIGVRMPQAAMFELLRTPTYSTWQGECWLFCCQYPMTFVGQWQREQFEERAPGGSAEKLYYSAVEGVEPDSWDTLGSVINAYVFECKRCGKLRGHYDLD